MNLFGKKTLVTGTAIALLTATFALSPASLSKTNEGIKISTSTAEAATSEWVYVETKKKNTGAKNAVTIATAAGLGALLAIPVPLAGPLSAFGTIILDKSLKTAYFTDKISMRMSGSTFQNKHEITMYSDSSYTKKLGSTITIIENISAGPKSVIIEEEM